MTIDKMLKRREHINLSIKDIPEKEHRHLQSIGQNIDQMDNWVGNFWSGRLLFRSCWSDRSKDPTGGEMYRRWWEGAARDCTMSIYHFGRLVEGIDQSLARCPVLRGKIDEVAKKGLRRKFELEFPAYIKIRNAVSHAAERTKTADDTKQHGAVKGAIEAGNLSVSVDEGYSLILHEGFEGEKYFSMWNGEIVNIELSEKSGDLLEDIVDRYWKVFRSMIDPTPEPLPIVSVGRD